MTPEEKAAKLKEYRHQYYLSNKEKIVSQVTAYREANRDRLRVANREFQRKNQATRRQTVRELIAKAKSCPCTDCGNSFPPYVMDLDHVRGDKVAPVGTMLSTPTVQRVLDEIAKCDVVCSNCHRIRTHSRKQVEDPTSTAVRTKWECPTCHRQQLAKPHKVTGKRRCRFCDEYF